MKLYVEDLKFSQKFLLIGILAVMMLAVPTALVVKADLRAMHRAQRELAGIAPARDALRLVQLTQQHRGLSSLVPGGVEYQAAARQAKQAEVGQALSKAQASAATLGDAKLTALAGNIASEWTVLSDAVGDKAISGPDSFTRHSALIAQQLILLEGITNTSRIILHPELAGHFLYVAVLRHLPNLTESLGQMRTHGALLLARGNASSEDKSQLAGLASAIGNSLRGARNALNLATEADPSLEAALAAPTSAAVSAAEDALRLVEQKIVRTEMLSFPPAEYFAAMTRNIDLQFELTGASLTVFQAQLERAAMASKRELTAVGAGLSVLSLLALGIMVVVTRATSASVQQALGLAQAVAAGDLSQQVKAIGRDEIGQLLQALISMNANLARVVRTVRGNADSVAGASAMIAQRSTDLALRTASQASALEETAASMDQLGSSVQQNADSARQANQLALSASAVAAKGGAVVGQVVATMHDISASSKQIADIIGVIDGIAFQTNILALNAAVEAARAGEQGRGFAVVAAEVRTLALRTAEAAKQIKTLIGASVKNVEFGSKLVGDAGATMDEIVAQVKAVSERIGEISLATLEQASSIGHIGEAVNQLDQLTQKNAAMVEDGVAAADTQTQQAARLVEAVSVFKLAHDDVQAVVPVVAAKAAPAHLSEGAERRAPDRGKNAAPRAFVN